MTRRAYPTDVTDDEWSLIEPLLPKPQRRGPRPNVNLREILNAIFYLLHEGCQWRALPNDLPLRANGIKLFQKMAKKRYLEPDKSYLKKQIERSDNGRNSSPSAGSIDSQSVKTTEKRGRSMGLMGGKKSKGVNDIF